MSKKILKADFVFGYVIRDVNLLYWNKCIAAMKKGKKMERYKVILVDDEAEVIDMIEKKIHWNDLGFEVAGSATNGVKALELVEKLQPDVVLTDIKMPYMDGLELSRRLNREYRIFISCSVRDLMSLNMRKKQCIWKSRNICSNRSMQQNCQKV